MVNLVVITSSGVITKMEERRTKRMYAINAKVFTFANGLYQFFWSVVVSPVPAPVPVSVVISPGRSTLRTVRWTMTSQRT